MRALLIPGVFLQQAVAQTMLHLLGLKHETLLRSSRFLLRILCIALRCRIDDAISTQRVGRCFCLGIVAALISVFLSDAVQTHIADYKFV